MFFFTSNNTDKTIRALQQQIADLDNQLKAAVEQCARQAQDISTLQDICNSLEEDMREVNNNMLDERAMADTISEQVEHVLQNCTISLNL